MAISDQDRQIAEDTFGLIERSTASGNSFEANQPAVASDTCPACRYGDCSRCGGEEPLTDGQCMCCYYSRPPVAVSMALAEHTASAIDKILGA